MFYADGRRDDGGVKKRGSSKKREEEEKEEEEGNVRADVQFVSVSLSLVSGEAVMLVWLVVTMTLAFFSKMMRLMTRIG